MPDLPLTQSDYLSWLFLQLAWLDARNYLFLIQRGSKIHLIQVVRQCQFRCVNEFHLPEKGSRGFVHEGFNYLGGIS